MRSVFWHSAWPCAKTAGTFQRHACVTKHGLVRKPPALFSAMHLLPSMALSENRQHFSAPCICYRAWPCPKTAGTFQRHACVTKHGLVRKPPALFSAMLLATQASFSASGLGAPGSGAVSFGPPLATPTMAGRNIRSPITKPGWMTSMTVLCGKSGLGASNIA